ncbi:hypothetical protein BCR36DRAFT_413038 [Piromyces finnis]|uniref:Uncharacterized protein n=1 Tax=Piromyces finnis TaxID=1754191 RepID=A0A1Y1V9D3_9FUNG|nr:hypothetical protein BCR36DRAFT_413038 [Piromyces finnis]|eukprot:ORX49042.1 hypothetical protein BCR36DRAFT_413038 [Piromyces finnis]
MGYLLVKKQFKKDVSRLITENQLPDKEVFSENDFSHLPSIIQKYIINCGYIGTPKMSYLTMKYKNVDFSQGRKGPNLKIDYTQYNFIKEPSRMAFIDSSMFGIPFEGYDYYENGVGGMKGVIAKIITLFNQKGEEMDKACLATFLAECFFAPTILLQDYIEFEEINDHQVRGTIKYKEQTASGIFTFNENFEMISFTTKDRAATGTDGSMEYIPWSALCSDYQVAKNGIKYPVKFQAVWNYPDDNFIYFDGVIHDISYGFENKNNS